MTSYLKITLLLLFSLGLLAGCLAPRGNSPADKRASIQQMKGETLDALYKEHPTAREVINKAAGYAVFSNISGQYIFVGGGGGYGVAVDRANGRETYMRMAQVGLGLGLGLQDVRAVFVFHSQRALDDFVTKGWEFGAQMDAAAKARDKGASVTGEVSIDPEITVYTLSEAGLLAKVNLAGTKYWRDDALN